MGVLYIYMGNLSILFEYGPFHRKTDQTRLLLKLRGGSIREDKYSFRPKTNHVFIVNIITIYGNEHSALVISLELSKSNIWSQIKLACFVTLAEYFCTIIPADVSIASVRRRLIC